MLCRSVLDYRTDVRKKKLKAVVTEREEMAEKGVQLDRKTVSCSICLDLLKDPVSINCGHSFCVNCIKTYWDSEEEKGVYSCPQCRQTFTPVLGKNMVLADLVEELKKTGLQAASADPCYAGPEDVACDVCSGRKLKACTSCLQCLASYCLKHLQPHFELPVFKTHKLVESSKKLQENVCSHHGEVMKMFCRTDQQPICYLCPVDQHKGHDTVSAAAERAEWQKDLEESRENIQQRIQDREKDVKMLQQEIEAINRSANKAMEHSVKTFAELIRLIQKRRSDVKQQVRSQQETEVSRVKELKEKLEQEIAELKRKDAGLQKLSLTEDHNQFLHSYPSLSGLSGSADSPSTITRPPGYFEDLTSALSELREKLEDVLKKTWTNISEAQVEVLLSEPEPKSRTGFLKYSRPITLDPDTANPQLLLSDGFREATRTEEGQSYPEHPKRFIRLWQILSKESLSGQCYWEVEWKGPGVRIAVAYEDMSRSGSRYQCGFGLNDKSWALDCKQNGCSFWHNNIRTSVSGPGSFKVGVYLDHSAGILSFYSVSETMTLLYRVQTTFTQPLHAGLWLRHCSPGSVAEFCNLN